jgi:DNA polymerase III subunit beta
MIEGEVTAKPQVFAAAVKWAAKFAAGKPAVPIQGGLLLTADGSGNLAVESFSEGITARALVPVDGDGKGSTIVSARLLDQLVATFADKPVTLSGDDETSLVIVAGRWTGTVPVMGDANDWSGVQDGTLVPPQTIGTVGGQAFADLIARAAASTEHDAGKPIALQCIHLTFGGRTVVAMASDSLRATRDAVPFIRTGESEHQAALVVGQQMTDVASAFIGPDDITVGLGPNVLALSSATRSVVVRQIAEPWQMGEVIATLLTDELPHEVLVKVSDLMQPMKRAVLMRDKDGPIAAVMSPGLITVHAKADQIQQKGSEEVDAQYSGPEHTLAFNPKYLADALGSAPGEIVRIAFHDQEKRPGRPWHVVLTSADDEGSAWQHLLMPLKLRG